ncbi:MAG: GvpL/GvpF family gas vesicle protein [Terriglobales bacterium]
MANRIGKKKTKRPELKRAGSGARVAGLKPGASTSSRVTRKKKISAENAEGRRTQSDQKQLLYLYGISENNPTLRQKKAEGWGTQIEGVDGRARVDTIECGGLVCWVSRVDAREFGEELQKRMENLDWLAGASVRHQRAVGAIHEKITVLPARFATLFLSQQTLAAHVKDSMAQIRRDLARVDGADEYGMKIFAAPQAEVATPAGSSGRDYLTRKSFLLQQANTPKMTPEVESFVKGLSGIASETAPGGSVSGGQRNLVWQGSFLVERRARKRLESALASFRGRASGFRVECTGPWPPYSFIAVKAEKR